MIRQEQRTGTVSPETEQRKNQHVVRVYPWDIEMADVVLDNLKQNVEPSIIGISMAVKSKTSIPSPGKLTPIGGKERPGESTLDAAYRGTREETTIHTVPYAEKSMTYVTEGDDHYVYTLNEKQYADTDRATSIVSFPVLNQRILRAHTPNEEVDKISGVVRLSIEELEEAQRTGKVNGSELIESCALVDSPHISINEDNRQKREKALTGLVAFLRDTDAAVKDKIIKKSQY